MIPGVTGVFERVWHRSELCRVTQAWWTFARASSLRDQTLVKSIWRPRTVPVPLKTSMDLTSIWIGADLPSKTPLVAWKIFLHRSSQTATPYSVKCVFQWNNWTQVIQETRSTSHYGSVKAFSNIKLLCPFPLKQILFHCPLLRTSLVLLSVPGLQTARGRIVVWWPVFCGSFTDSVDAGGHELRCRSQWP